VKKPLLAAPHGEPCHNRSPSLFQQRLTHLNPPCPLGHRRLHCRPLQRRSLVRTPPPKLAFATSLVLRRLGESHHPPPHLAQRIGHSTSVLVPPIVHCLDRRCADSERATAPRHVRVPRGDRARATTTGLGRPGQIQRWTEPARGGLRPNGGPLLFIPF
jgi:hypothetical protein